MNVLKIRIIILYLIWSVVYINRIVFIIIVIGKILLLPLKIIMKLVVNALSGGVLLFMLNILGSVLGFYVNITPLNAIIAGIFGVPGVIFLAIFT